MVLGHSYIIYMNVCVCYEVSNQKLHLIKYG